MTPLGVGAEAGQLPRFLSGPTRAKLEAAIFQVPPWRSNGIILVERTRNSPTKTVSVK
jgi:hypothetical protein